MALFSALSRDLSSENMQGLLDLQKTDSSNGDANEIEFSSLIPEVTDEIQKQSVSKLRSVLGNKVLESHKDYDLLRFIKARNYDITNAASMYNEMLEIRKQFGSDQSDFMQTHTPMDAFINHYPFGLLGYDKEGCPVAYDFPGRVDVKGFSLAMSELEFSKQVQ